MPREKKKAISPDLFNPEYKPPPKADIAREAVTSLKGYAFQIALSALAWIRLRGDERLYLEVAEDYAVVAADALKAVQVKASSASAVTLISTDVIEAVTNFVDLVSRNPDTQVSLHLLTTAAIGLERNTANRPAGEAGLLYWRKAAARNSIEPLRSVLLSEAYPDVVHTFVEARDDNALRVDLLKRIHWNCSGPDFDDVLAEIEGALVRLGREHFDVPAEEAKRLVNIILFEALRCATRPDRAKRFLTLANLYSVIDESTRLTLRRSDVNKLTGFGAIAAAAFGSQAAPIVLTPAPSWIFENRDMPTQPLVVVRPQIVSSAQAVIADQATIILVGATGLGKTLLAQSIAQASGGKFSIVDFRDVDRSVARQRLDTLLSLFDTLNSEFLIFDDLNCMDDPAVSISLLRVLRSVRNRDRTIIITCYRKPGPSTIAKLGFSDNTVLDVPYFSEEEVGKLVTLASGSADDWTKIAMAAGGNGHPQLTNALIRGLALRGWPTAERSKIVLAGFLSVDVEQSKDVARRRLIEELPEDARALLFRASLILSSFKRPLAIALGAVEPEIRRPGEAVDTLAGPWLEIVGQNTYRVSPLAVRSGNDVLSAQEQKSVHATVAGYLLQGGKIKVTDVDSIFLHSLLGDADGVLGALASTTATASREVLEAIGEYTVTFPNLRTDALPYPRNPALSAMLRIAQFKVLTAKSNFKKMAECAVALMREIDALLPFQRSMMELVAFGTVLFVPGIAVHLPNWLELIVRFARGMEADSEVAKMIGSAVPPPELGERTLPGVLVSIGLAGASSVEELEELMHRLSSVSVEDRNLLLQDYSEHNENFDVAANGAWLAESKSGKLDGRVAASRYHRMATLMESLGRPGLAAYCYKCEAIMLDEYGGTAAEAFAVLDTAESQLGARDPLTRERLKILWRLKEDGKVIELTTRVATDICINEPIERMFLLRESAISAFRAQNWSKAIEWFELASEAATATGSFDVLALGLQIDASISKYCAGDIAGALQGLAKVLADLRRYGSETSLRAVYTRNIVRHAILWVKIQIEPVSGLIKEFDSWFPGAGSNPEPLEVIRERKLGPADLSWYMLAETELKSGIEAGIASNLDQLLEEGRIPTQEAEILRDRIGLAIVRNGAASFAGHFRAYLEAISFVRQFYVTNVREFDVFNPPRDAIPSIPLDGLASDESLKGHVSDAIMAFLMHSSLTKSGAYDKIELEMASALGSAFPGRNIFEGLRTGAGDFDEIDRIIFAMISRLQGEAHLTPLEVCETALRFWARIAGSDFKFFMTPALAFWLRARWSSILSSERFRLDSPALTVPPIEALLTSPDNDRNFVARFLLAICEAAKLKLSAEYKQVLQSQTTEPPSLTNEG